MEKELETVLTKYLDEESVRSVIAAFLIYSAEMKYNWLYMKNDSALEYTVDMIIESVGIEKAKLVGEAIRPIKAYLEKYIDPQTGQRKTNVEDEWAEVDRLLSNSGINRTTYEIEDEERFKEFVFEISEKNLTRDLIEFLNSPYMSVVSEEKRSLILSKVGQYSLYKELKNPLIDGSLVDYIIKKCPIIDLDIPAELTRGLEEIILPALRELGKLRSVNVEENNPKYSSRDGVLFNKEVSELILYPPQKAEKSYLIPDSVEMIKRDAFKGLREEPGELEALLVNPENKEFSSINGVLYNKEGSRLLVYPPSKKDEEFRLPPTVEVIESDFGGKINNIKKVIAKLSSKNNEDKVLREIHSKLPFAGIELLPPTFEDAIELGYVSSEASPEEQNQQYKKFKKVLKLSNYFYLDFYIELNDSYRLAEKMYDLLGEDETREMLKIPRRFEQEPPQRFFNSPKFKELYDKKISLKGPLPVTVDILKYLYGQFGKNARKDLFEKINTILDDKSNVDKLDKIILELINSLNINIDKDKFEGAYKEFIKKDYSRNEHEIKEIVADKVNSNGLALNGHLGIIAGLLEKTIRKNYFQEGNVDQALELLRKELGRVRNGELMYEGILGNQSIIEKLLIDIYRENNSIVQNNIRSKMKESKQLLGNGWIMRLIQNSKDINLDAMTKEEFEQFIQKLKVLDKDTFSIGTFYEMKRDASLFKVLRCLLIAGYKRLITYEKAERMFSTLQKPYSENFKKWFLDNKEEILDNERICDALPKIHEKFDDTIIGDNHVIQTMLDNGEMSGMYALNQYYQSIGKNVFDVHDMFTYWIHKKNLDDDPTYVAELETIYEVTKKREKSYIPSAEKTEKAGKVTYRGRLLRADDPLNLIMGNVTSCCQKIRDVGENSMRHASMESTGRTFVVEEIDEYGRSRGIVAQSWVWRNNGTLCFDNIEVPAIKHSKLKNGQSANDIACQKAILDIYKSAANIALEKDKKKFDELLRKGKITKEQYDAFRLTLVTVGTGLSDLRNFNRVQFGAS